MVKQVYGSQEIIRNSFLLDFVTFPGSRVVLDVILLEIFVNIHDGCLIVTAVAVIGGREDGGYVFVVGGGVTLHHELVGPCDHSKVISMVKLLCDVLAKGVTCSTRIHTPP